jgi:hypothetical protein
MFAGLLVPAKILNIATDERSEELAARVFLLFLGTVKVHLMGRTRKELPRSKALTPVAILLAACGTVEIARGVADGPDLSAQVSLRLIALTMHWNCREAMKDSSTCS